MEAVQRRKGSSTSSQKSNNVEKQIDNHTDYVEKPNQCWGTRHTFALMGFFGFANVYAMRVNLSVAIVAMVNTTYTGNDTNIGNECPVNSDEELGNNGGEFNWDSVEQGWILGAFFYGYVSTQIPGGVLAERYGGKWLFGVGTFLTALFTLLTPIAAKAGTGAFIAIRVLEGLGEGVTFPAMHAMVSKWIPFDEKSRWSSFIAAGAQAGTVISMPISGILADEVGWPSVFYVFGTLGVIWFAFWIFLVYNSPAEHPRISNEERNYIENNIPSLNEGQKLPIPPWKHIMTSVPFIALIFAHMGQNWGFYTLLTETPTYLSNIQHFPLKQNGFLSALPYLCQWIAALLFGVASDYVTKNNIISTTNARKLFNSIGLYGPAIGLIWLSVVGCRSTQAIIALCLACGLNGGIYSGFQFNHVDLSPNYAGTLMGITNTLANICGFVTPYVTGAITHENQTIQAWRFVFLLASLVYIVFNTVFVIFGKAEVQPWNTYWLMDA